MKKFVCILAAVMFVMLAIVPTMAGAESRKTVYVNTANGKSLNLREEPAAGSRIITRLGVGKPLTVIKNVDKTWMKVSAAINGKTVEGYVMKKFVSNQDPTVKAQEFHNAFFKGTVTPSRGAKGYVNLRAEANTHSTVLARLTKGTVVTVVAESQAFYQVALSNGMTGYIVKAFLTR